MDSYFDIEFLANNRLFTYRIPFFCETNLIMVFDFVDNEDSFFEYIYKLIQLENQRYPSENSIINDYIKSKEDIEEITIYLQGKKYKRLFGGKKL